ncbi:hypothetical protein CORC01_07335 [Colletotrichum orchidophilum]|uniref:Uncharacterized protein n=1 Tax=Colletotrichum orchidophilum TaxID=1209926 RepID=A0A1G4B755_9PEZI|nr:uncharacterized protein CORC01_07335 [Colletotrichum orchidophilum]OHE97280.1 hypothetical protein CORC01_07335 [Colletotrichum orchidophilum]
MFRTPLLVPAFMLALTSLLVNGQSSDALGVGNGFLDFKAGQFTGQLVKDSQTLASLKPGSDFDFLPSDLLANLTLNSAHHIGDVSFRFRLGSVGNWTTVDSAAARKPVKALNDLAPGVIAAADLAATLPAGVPLTVTREWLPLGDGLALRINLTNTANGTVELGALGLPVAINNIFSRPSAEETQAKCSLADPYIGLDAGYVRVSPIKGLGDALVVAPLGSSPLEAWRLLAEPTGDFSYQSQTYEGTYEWMIHSQAWADNEWKSATPWNTPTSKTLKARETYSVGLKFVAAESIQTIEDAVTKADIPLAVGIPGYVVPADLTARLYLTHPSPVKTIDSQDSFTIKQDTTAKGSPYLLTPTAGAWGRAKLTITYEDGKTQVVQYYITKPAPDTVSDLGHFLTTAAHFTNASDPFGRAPSIMGYDKEANAIVTQDARVWIAGLSDEGGTGAYVAAATKLFVQPVEAEVAVVDEFIHDTIVGTVQPANDTFAVRASTFFYQPDAVDYAYDSARVWTSWTSWNKERAYTTVRAYNYVHPVVAYWSMYRVARDYPQVKTRADWSWYLNQAYHTVQHCLKNGAKDCDYGLTGLMGETVFAELLEDLKRENMTKKAASFEANMRYRAEFWETLAVPFGSEMAYFGHNNTAIKAINSIRGYMPTVAHWGWNGNARRYWDFLYGAKHEGIERQVHHYGSGLNSLPMLHYYERNPSDFDAIRVAFAGNTAPLTNIDGDGCPSAAFHSFPQHLAWDPYTGDYGLGFLGLGLGQAVYIINHETYGAVVFGGNVVASTETTLVAEPRDAVRRRVFVADLGLKVVLSAGAIQTVTYDQQGPTVKLSVRPAASEAALKATSTIVWLQTTVGEVKFTVSGAGESRGGYLVDLSGGQAEVTISKA